MGDVNVGAQAIGGMKPTRKQSKILVPLLASCGLVIAFLNIVMIWRLINKTINSFTLDNGQTINRLLLEYRFFQSRNCITLVALGVAFALICIGFSSTVMGLESSYSIEGAGGGVTKFSLAASSPGILCFLCATVIVLSVLLKPMVYDATTSTEYTASTPPKKSSLPIKPPPMPVGFTPTLDPDKIEGGN